MSTCDLKFISNKTLSEKSITDYKKKNKDPKTDKEKEERKSKIMKETDTLHDMHSTGRGVGDSADIQWIINDQFEKHDGVDAATFMAISTVGKGDPLIEGAKYYYGSDANANAFGTPGSSGRGKGLSNLETTMAKFFDETYDLPSLCKSEFISGETLSYTIKQIMDEPDKFIALMDANKTKIDVIEIQVPVDKEAKQKLFKTPANEAKIKKVATFILKFFFPGSYGKVLFPIDAKSGPLPCIFQDIDSVGNLATALTIGDSATGGVDEKKNKSESALSCRKQSRDIPFNQPNQPLFFPFTEPIPKRRYVFDSQEFTKKIYKIYYTEKAKRPFNSQNKDSMVLVVERIPTAAGGAAAAVWEAPFELSNSGSTLSGVGVPTLKKLITIIEDAARPPISLSSKSKLKPKPKPKRIPLKIPSRYI